MTAQIIREARPQTRSRNMLIYCAHRGALRINNKVWESRIPATMAEAATINNDARAICAELNKP